MRKLIVALCALVPLSAQNGPPDVALYQTVLDRFVTEDGSVNYAGLKADRAPLDRFVGQIGKISPDSHPQLFPTRQDRLAYWINAYNALVLWAMAKDYPQSKNLLQTVLGRAGFFYQRTFQVGGKSRTLSSIEDDSLRRAFSEPRIHFCIVCASRGCPWLARTAFRAGNVDQLLEARARLFWNQKRNFRLAPETRQLFVSSIFNWFEKDFGASMEARLEFLARYRPTDVAQSRRADYRLAYIDYDWSLNLASDP